MSTVYAQTVSSIGIKLKEWKVTHWSSELKTFLLNFIKMAKKQSDKIKRQKKTVQKAINDVVLPDIKA